MPLQDAHGGSFTFCQPPELLEALQRIDNNFQTMAWLQDLQDTALTPVLVLGLHRRITQNTLDTSDAAGRLRNSSANVRVEDFYGDILHEPPPAEQFQQRLADLCAFANSATPATFIHPVILAITLHFWLAYDHPFVDDNGRTVWALSYWAMLRNGYWLFSSISISTILRTAPRPYADAFRKTETAEHGLLEHGKRGRQILFVAPSDLAQRLRQRAVMPPTPQACWPSESDVKDMIRCRQEPGKTLLLERDFRQ